MRIGVIVDRHSCPFKPIGYSTRGSMFPRSAAPTGSNPFGSRDSCWIAGASLPGHACLRWPPPSPSTVHRPPAYRDWQGHAGLMRFVLHGHADAL